jgi:hypothetical protein
MAKFDYCSHKTIIDMIEFFYDIKLNEEQKKMVYEMKTQITPAELSKIMFEHFGDVKGMFEGLECVVPLKDVSRDVSPSGSLSQAYTLIQSIPNETTDNVVGKETDDFIFAEMTKNANSLIKGDSEAWAKMMQTVEPCNVVGFSAVECGETF